MDNFLLFPLEPDGSQTEEQILDHIRDNEGLILTTVEEEDGSLTIEWDHEDPIAIALGINDWTEQDWIDALMSHAEQVLEEHGEQLPEQDAEPVSE